jgi:hypothetical protein
VGVLPLPPPAAAHALTIRVTAASWAHDHRRAGRMGLTLLRALNISSAFGSTTLQPRSASMTGMPSIRHADLELRCTSCGDRFVYSAGEQELNTVRGVVREPRECPTCRKLLGRG